MPTPPPTATTSASTKDRAPCRSSSTVASTRSAREGSCTPSIWPRANGSGASTRRRRSRRGWGFFGRAGSPLVEDGRVIANIGDSFDGGGIVAFNADTGAVLWQATKHEASYSSPVGATFDGKRRALFFTRRGLVGLDPATGARDLRTGVAVAIGQLGQRRDAARHRQPDLPVGDLRDGRGRRSRSSGDSSQQIWANDDALSNHYATSVHRNGILYGFHGRQEFGPSFRAVDLKTGAVKWSEEKFRAGTVTLAGDRLLILREGGELVMAEATPEAFRPMARAQILPAVVRGYPAIADGFLYARNSDTPEERARLCRLRYACSRVLDPASPAVRSG